uniref:Histone-lysine N-methyltransferase n=1 Tax=Anopheles epiroticus TaxID=199890 RepID=A0A182PD15_9DIPT
MDQNQEEKESEPAELPAQSTDGSQADAMLNAEETQSDEMAASDEPLAKEQQCMLTNGNDGDEQMETTTNRKRRFKCCNVACKKQCQDFCTAPQFAYSLYKVPRAPHLHSLCMDCFNDAVERYESLSTLVVNKQPLLLHELPPGASEEVYLVLDSSSDEEDEETLPDRRNETVLPREAISLVESDLNDIINTFYNKYCINQVKWSNTIMLHEAQENEKKTDRIEAKIKSLSKVLQGIHSNIYSVHAEREDKPELIIEDDVTSERIAHERFLSTMKKSEKLQRESVKVGNRYYGVRTTILASWSECQVLEDLGNVSIVNPKFVTYTVKFLVGESKLSAVSAKHLAYTTHPTVKLRLGTRVIARISSNPNDAMNRAFYAGTVLESISNYNNFRYLITFDSGHTLYAPFTDVRVVCDQSENVWDDVHLHSREFIRNYLQSCGTVRPMLQAKRGQRLLVEIDQKWYPANVIETDSSLVRLHFPALEKKEWIYRGSRRLGPLYREVSTSHALNKKFSKFQKRNEPSIEYVSLDDEEIEGLPVTAKPAAVDSLVPKLGVPEAPIRATARKSTMNRKQSHNSNNEPGVVSLNRNTIFIDEDLEQSNGSVVFFTTKNYRGPQRYVPHECGPDCLYQVVKHLRTYNLLARPLITGWERQLASVRGHKKASVLYRAPCGRRIRNWEELKRYLRVTDCKLNVEHFDFDPDIRALALFQAKNVLFECKDLSFGLEPMPVHCVNSYEDKSPPKCQYSNKRIPTEGVNLNLDKGFLCGCDCEDDCSDKSKCQCWQLTIAGARFKEPNININTVGYQYKRLHNSIQAGIYECNVQCKCQQDKCLNRVVQNSLQTKLEVFNTHNKGWGIRCLNDVPKGSFICIYAGHLLTEEVGNKICEMSEDKFGDEYFADLDYIESVEKLKAHYEEEAYHSDNEDTSSMGPGEDSDESEGTMDGGKFGADQDSDEEYRVKTKSSGPPVKTRAHLRRASVKERPNRSKKVVNDGVNDEQERVSLIPNPKIDMNASGGPNEESKFRKLYGENERVYIMDAKRSGNLGRYFNHSCNPNLFVQNVFVDTHDLRFPWVAFFAERNITAGTELTWNYNYDVGSVKGKVLTCNCGEKNCMGRLL